MDQNIPQKSVEGRERLRINMRKVKRVRRAEMNGTVIPKRSVHANAFVHRNDETDYPTEGEGYSLNESKQHRSSLSQDQIDALRKAFS